jgi:hypothetical protein
VNANGLIRRMDHRDILLNLFWATRSKGTGQYLLRRHDTSIASIPILARAAPPSSVRRQELTARGEWQGIRFTARWCWRRCGGMVLARGPGKYGPGHRHRGSALRPGCGLTHYDTVRLNEYYRQYRTTPRSRIRTGVPGRAPEPPIGRRHPGSLLDLWGGVSRHRCASSWTGNRAARLRSD